MRLLLDTHALIWWFLDRGELSERAGAAIGDEANIVYVSAASLFEISTKHRIGKLPQVELLLRDVDGLLAEQSFSPLPITLRHGATAGTLAGAHKDPFDRMLAAQAILEDMALISADAALDRFGVRRFW